MVSVHLRTVEEKLQLKGNETQHEQTDSWSNRDLIPLPPSRRTWGAFHYFGYWAISSLNVSNWQTPNTILSKLVRTTLTLITDDTKLWGYLSASPWALSSYREP
jgi:cytosine/uracil/thiamine/allantoin permease